MKFPPSSANPPTSLHTEGSGSDLTTEHAVARHCIGVFSSGGHPASLTLPASPSPFSGTLSALSLLLFTFFAAMAGASAQTSTWDGGGGDGNWTNALNWTSDTVPLGAGDLIFAGNTGLTSTNNLTGAALSNKGFVFNNGAGAFTLNGTAMTLTSYITNNSANLQTINMGIILGGNLTIAAAMGNIAMNGAITGANGFTKTGAGTLTLAGNNTYTGATTVTNGMLKAASTNALSAGSAFAVGAGATLDLGGFNNTIKSLSTAGAGTITDSSAAGSGGTLKITTALSGTLTNLFTGSLGLNFTGNSILNNANNTYSGGTIYGASSAGSRWIGNGTIGATNASGVVTSGILGTGTITIGLAATDIAQFYLTGATIINNAVVVNTARGDGSSLGTFRVESGPLTLNGAINANLADLTIQAQNGTGRTATVNGVISGASGLSVLTQANGAVYGGLTVTVNNASNSYAGNTTINGTNAILKLGANQNANRAQTGSLIVTNGGALNMNGFSDTVNALTGNGTVNGASGTPTLTVGVNNGSGTFSGVITNTAGSLALVKMGTGTQTLSGSNSYTSATTVTNGTLQIGAGGATGSLATNSTISVGSGATLAFNRSNTVTQGTDFSGAAISGAGSLSQNGTGTLTLSASNSYTGATIVSAGTLLVGNANALGGTTSLTMNGGTLDLGGFTSGLGAVTLASGVITNGSFTNSSAINAQGGTIAATILGTGSLTKSGTGTLTLSASNSYTGATIVSAGTLVVSNTYALGATNAALNVASGTLTNSAFNTTVGAVTLGNGSITGSGTLTGASYSATNTGAALVTETLAGTGTFTQSGTGTTTLTGSNSYSGGTILNAGTLALSNNYALGTGTLTFASNSTTLLGLTGLTLSNNISFATGITATVNNGGFALVKSGSVSGSGNVTYAGAGTTTLSASNSYTGATIVSAGTLRMGNTNALGRTGSLTVNGGTFDLNGFNVTVAMMGAGNSAGTISNGASGSGTSTLTISNFTVNLATLITDGTTAKTALNFTNSGGTPILGNGNNTFSGGLTIGSGGTRLYQISVTTTTNSNGTIQKSSFGTGTVNIGTPGSTGAAQLMLLSGSIYNNIVVNAATFADGGSGALRIDGTVSSYGTITAGASDINISSAGSGALTSYGQLTSSGTNGLLLKTPGTSFALTLANTNTNSANNYWGNTTLQNKTILKLGAADQIASGMSAGNLVISNGATFNMAGFNETINGLTGAGTVDGMSGTPTLTIGDNNASSTFSGVIKNTAGNLALTKIGTGTLSLSGSNTFSGVTTVNAGVLDIVNSNSLYGGTNIVSANTTVLSGATLAFGVGGASNFSSNAISALLNGSLMTNTALQGFQSGSSIGFDVAGGNFTLTNNVANSGNGALGLYVMGANTLTLSGANTFSGGTIISGSTLLLSGGDNRLSTNVAVSFGSGATLNLGGNSQTLTGLTGAGTVTNTAGTLTLNIGATNNTFGGVIAGAGSLTKSGAGTLTLTNANTYSGITTISAGTLQIGNGVTDGSIGSTASIADNGTLAYNLLGSQTIGVVISGTGSLAKSGSGTLTLTGANSYGGATTINGGTLQIGNGGATGSLAASSAISIGSGATLTFNKNTNITQGVDFGGAAISGAGALIKNGSGNLYLTNANTYSGGTTLNNGYLYVSNSAALGTGTVTLNAGQFLALNAPVLNNNFVLGANASFITTGLAPSTLTIDGVVSGSGPLAISGAFGVNMTLNNTNNSFTGMINIANGSTLNISSLGMSGSNSTAGAGSSILLNAGNVFLNYTGTGDTSDRAITMASQGADSKTINNNGSGALVLTGVFSTTVGNRPGAILTLGGSNTNANTISSALSNSFSGADINNPYLALTKQDAGLWKLSGSNTFTGATLVSGGVLVAVNSNSLYGGTNIVSTNTTVLGGATLAFGVGGVSNFSSIAISDLLAGSLMTNTALQGFRSGSSIGFDVSGGNFTLTNNVANSGNGALGLYVMGANTLTLSGASTFSGGTTINASTLRYGVANTLLTNGSVTLTNGSTLNLGGFTSTLGAVTLASGVITNGSFTNSSTINAQGGTIAATILGTGSLTKSGSGTTTLSASNSYTGATTVNAGTLRMGNANALGGTGTLTVSGGLLDLNGYNVTVARVGAGNSAGTISNSAAGSGTSTLTISNFSVNLATLITDGTTAKTAVAIGSYNTPIFVNANNTFSGGLTIANSARLWQGSVTTTLNGDGTIQKSSLGTGTVNIGNGSTDGQLMLSSGSMYNNVIVNANTFADGGAGGSPGAAFRIEGTGIRLYGQITAGAADISFSSGSSGAVTNYGQLTSSGTNGLTLKTPGTSFALTLANTNTNSANNYRGNTTLQNKTILNLGAADQIANGTNAGNLVISNGATFNMAGFNETINGLTGAGTVEGGTNATNAPTLTVGDNNASSTFSGVIKNTAGNLALTKIGTGTLTLTGTNTYTGGTTINAGTLQVGNGVTDGSIGSTASIINNGTLGFNLAGSQTIGALISGTGSLLKSGNGTLTLSGDNTFSGGITINAGTMIQGADYASGPYNNLTINNGGTFDLGGYTAVVGNLAGTTGGLLTNTGSPIGDLWIQNDGNSTYGGVIGYNGAVVKKGAGTLTLTGVNTYLTTAVSEGTLLLSGGDNRLSTNGKASVSNSATMDLGGYSQTLTGLTGVGTVTNSAGTLTLDIKTTTNNFAGSIVGAGSLAKSGEGTLTLTGSNTYTGGTTISGGTLAINSSNALSGSVAMSGGASFLNYYGAGATTLANNITVGSGSTGTINNTSGSLLTLSGNLTKQGSVLQFAGGSYNVTGTITGTSVGGGFDSDLVLNNATMTLSSAANYYGPTKLLGGSSLIAGVGNALPSSTVLHLGQDGESSSITNSYNLNGYSQTLGGLYSAGNGINGIYNESATQSLLNLAGAGNYGGSINGNIGLTVSGGGTMNLTGVNNYTGTTTLSGIGTALNLGTTGSLSGTSNVVVSAGTTLLLGASNQVNTTARLTLDGGTLSMGGNGATRAGTQTFSTLTLTANSIIDFANLSGNSTLSFNSFVMNGNLLSIYNWSGQQSSTQIGTYTSLLSATALSQTDLDNIMFYSGSGSGFLGSGFYTGSEIVPVPVPEPAVVIAALMLIGWLVASHRATLLALLRRRRS